MRLPIFQVDAFTSQVFCGNPAAVVPLEFWPEDIVLQQIARENNLSETAFFVRSEDAFELRWFTPTVEVDLCGHATLASAFVIASELGYRDDPIRFATRSGELLVTPQGDGAFTLNFPSQPPAPCVEFPEELLPALGLDSAEVYAATDYVVVVADELAVRTLVADTKRLTGLPLRGVCVTAAGATFDFVSRWFGPNVGVDEDPVTGSAHCALAPLWAAKLGKSELLAAQVSERGGEIHCRVSGERVFLTGSAVLYLRGEIYL